MIKDVIYDQRKDPRDIHIWISFWPAENDDGYDGNDEDEDHYEGDHMSSSPTTFFFLWRKYTFFFTHHDNNQPQ